MLQDLQYYKCVFMLLKICFDLIGMLAWGVVTTILIILILIKRWLLAKCKCQCPQCLTPAPTMNQSTPPASQPENIQMHTPPSLATTPSTCTATTPSTCTTTPQTPSTVTSTKPLLSLEKEDAVAHNTRSKTAKRQLTL